MSAEKHPGYFWVCFWMWMLFIGISLHLGSIKKAIKDAASSCSQSTKP